MASRVVRPETTRVSISNGDWLQLKKRLSHGEQQTAFAHRYVATEFGNRVNLQRIGMDRVLAFLVDWSLVGLDDQVIAIRGKSTDEVEAALNAIDPESFAEIKAAVEQHELAMAAERTAAKNGTAGETASAAISPSPCAAAGASSGSEN
jgi:hypothetical protein